MLNCDRNPSLSLATEIAFNELLSVETSFFVKVLFVSFLVDLVNIIVFRFAFLIAVSSPCCLFFSLSAKVISFCLCRNAVICFHLEPSAMGSSNETRATHLPSSFSQLHASSVPFVWAYSLVRFVLISLIAWMKSKSPAQDGLILPFPPHSSHSLSMALWAAARCVATRLAFWKGFTRAQCLPGSLACMKVTSCGCRW